MPTTQTGSNPGSYDNTLAVPVDTDLVSASSVQTPFQSLLNKAKWLYDKVATTGVDAVRSVADITALKALTGMPSGAVAVVRSAGLYIYVDPSATAEALPWVVQPTVGTGRWFHVMQALRNVASGFAALDGSAKLSVAQVPNGLAAALSATNGAVVRTSGTGMETVLTLALGSLNVGDTVIAFASGFAQVEDGANIVQSQNGSVFSQSRLVISDNGTLVGQPGILTSITSGGAGAQSVSTSWQYVITSAGPASLYLQLACALATGDHCNLNPGGRITALVVRP